MDAAIVAIGARPLRRMPIEEACTTDPAAHVELALAGDQAAWAALYDALAPDVQRFRAGLGLPARTQLDGAGQEALVRVVRHLPRLGRARALRPFGLGGARHVAGGAMRKQRTADRTLERASQRVSGTVEAAS